MRKVAIAFLGAAASMPEKRSRKGLAVPVENLKPRKVIEVSCRAVHWVIPGRAGPTEAALAGERLGAIVEIAVRIGESIHATIDQGFASRLTASYLTLLFLDRK